MLNRADEDVEQEIYIRLWQKFSTYHEQDKFGAWVRVVAENYCKDYLRSKSRKLLAATVSEEDGGLDAVVDGEHVLLVRTQHGEVVGGGAADELADDGLRAVIEHGVAEIIRLVVQLLRLALAAVEVAHQLAADVRAVVAVGARVVDDVVVGDDVHGVVVDGVDDARADAAREPLERAAEGPAAALRDAELGVHGDGGLQRLLDDGAVVAGVDAEVSFEEF